MSVNAYRSFSQSPHVYGMRRDNALWVWQLDDGDQCAGVFVVVLQRDRCGDVPGGGCELRRPERGVGLVVLVERVEPVGEVGAKPGLFVGRLVLVVGVREELRQRWSLVGCPSCG